MFEQEHQPSVWASAFSRRSQQVAAGEAHAARGPTEAAGSYADDHADAYHWACLSAAKAGELPECLWGARAWSTGCLRGAPGGVGLAGCNSTDSTSGVADRPAGLDAGSSRSDMESR